MQRPPGLYQTPPQNAAPSPLRPKRSQESAPPHSPSRSTHNQTRPACHQYPSRSAKPLQPHAPQPREPNPPPATRSPSFPHSQTPQPLPPQKDPFRVVHRSPQLPPAHQSSRQSPLSTPAVRARS